MDHDDAPRLGETVRRHRLAAGLTQDDLATQAGVSVRALRDLERGSLRQPRAATVRRLAEILGLTPTQREMLLAGLTSAAADDDGPWVGVLGPLDVRLAGRTVDIASKRSRALLGLLTLHHGHVLSIAEIIDVLWGEDPPRTARNLVQIAVSELRTLLGTGARSLGSVSGGYALQVPDQRLDLARFDDLASRAHAAHAAGGTVEAFDLFARALEWWRGPVLADADDRLRQHPAAVAVRRRRIAATLAFADIAVARGEVEQVLPALRALSHEDPLHEAVAGRLMLALATAGERTAALNAFTEFRDRLANELGIDPGAELRSVHLRLLTGDAPDATTVGTAARPIPAQLPAPPAHFMGRRDELDALDELLAGSDPHGAKICLITGAPGVGKTGLAVHWAHQVAKRFPDGQLYVNLRGFDPTMRAMSPGEAVRGFLDAAGVPAERIPSGPDAQTALYRSLMSGRRVLVVLDNARGADQVRSLLPGTPTAVVVVTSRDQLSPLVAREGALPFNLQVPSHSDARDLLAGRLGARRVGREPRAVDQIITACARLPLALVIAAARAQQTSFPLSALAAELESTGQRLNRLDAGDATTQVRAAFSWSYTGLTSPAARLLRLLAVHPPPDAGAAAAASLAGRPLAEAQALLAELTRANLLEETTPGRYACHDLLKAYATELSQTHDPEDQRQAAASRLLDHYLHSALACDRTLDRHRPKIAPSSPAPAVASYEPDDQEQALGWFTAERPALLAAVDLAAEVGLHRHSWQLAWALETYLDRLGYWTDLAATLTTAEAAARQQGDRAGQAHAHRGLARAYARMEHHADAHTHLRHAIGLYQELGDQMGEASAYRNLAYVYEKERRYGAALDYNRQALALFLSMADRQGEAKALNAIGWCYALLGEPENALPYCQLALALNELLGNRHAQAVTWDSLGYAHLRLGDHNRAIASYRQAIAIYNECGDRLYAATALSYLGDAHRANGEVGEARGAWLRALSIMESLDRPEAADVRAKLTQSRIG